MAKYLFTATVFKFTKINYFFYKYIYIYISIGQKQFTCFYKEQSYTFVFGRGFYWGLCFFFADVITYHNWGYIWEL